MQKYFIWIKNLIKKNLKKSIISSSLKGLGSKKNSEKKLINQKAFINSNLISFFNKFKKNAFEKISGLLHKNKKKFDDYKENKVQKTQEKFTDEQLLIIQKSIPRLNIKKKIKISGATLIALIALMGFAFFTFYIIAVSHSYVIGIGSYSNYSNFTNRIFFMLIPDFWNKFVMRETYTAYSFFNNIYNNLNNAASAESLFFSLGFYVSGFAGLVQVILVFILFSISVYQKVNRNIWIALFSLIPIVGPLICVYYMGVLHYEHTFSIQKVLNQNNLVINQDKNLKEQLIDLTKKTNKPSLKKKEAEMIDLLNEKKAIDPFSYEDPIGS